MPCTLHLHLTGDSDTFLELRNGAILQGKQVVIKAPNAEVRILDNSSLFVSGQSISVNGTKNVGVVGASFIAQGGGYCAADNQGS